MLNHMSSHGIRVAPIVSDMARNILWHKHAKKHKTEFSDREIMHLKAHLDAYELPELINGVNFSRVQVDELIRQRRRKGVIEFETLGPYLIDYIDSNGLITLDTLIPEDRIGLEIAIKLRKLFPAARLISLYDDLNTTHANNPDVSHAEFSSEVKANFRSSLLELFKVAGIVSVDAKDGEDYLLISESSKIKSAEQMIIRLEKLGNIARHGQEIWFVNDAAENLLYKKFQLRSKHGHWLCVALDAASFLAEKNKRICHLIVLPDYMKEQQDMVWEILRVFNLHPLDYHNIFYPANGDPRQLAKVIWNKFQGR